jgi:hypothetical protein
MTQPNPTIDRKLYVVAEQQRYSEEEAEEILRLAARKESGGIPRDRLVQMAAELGISSEQIVHAEREFLAKRDAEVERRKGESQVLRDFWGHVATYAVVNGGLVLMDVIPDGQIDWAYWPLLGWGIGLACHIVSVFWSNADDAESSHKWPEGRTLTIEQREFLDECAAKYPGQKLMMIKEFQERYGLGLRESKDVVDHYWTANPRAFNPYR